MRTTTAWLLVIGALALGACNDTPAPADAALPPADAPVILRCPTTMVPAPDELMLPCCYRMSQASQLDAPEMRLRFIDITEPAGSPLAGDLVGNILNTALQEETFNWLFRTTGADGDGPVEITTGFGRRDATTGTYRFSLGTAGTEGDPDSYLPITMAATLAGETVTSDVVTTPLTVPIFDEAGTTVQIELVLSSMRILSTTLSADRSCIGALMTSRGAFTTAATLGGFIQVAQARAGTIMVGAISASLCGVVAGDITDSAYCDQPQGDWAVPPNSLCDTAGVCHRDGEGGVDCDPATTCNAWYLEADFAAHGIDIE